MRPASIYTVLVLVALARPVEALEQVTQPFQGVTLIHRTETSPRPLDIYIAIVDTLAPGIRFCATPESPYAPDLVVAQTTRSFLTQAGAQLGVNGDFYASAGTYNGFVHRDPTNFAASDGNVYSPFESTRPAFHVAANNVAHTVVATSQTTSGKLQPNPAVPVWNAVGGSDYLIQNGAVPTTWRDPTFANALHPRTAIGVSADRTQIAMFVVDGRQSHSGGMTLPEIGNMLLNDYGMHWAINLDGGGSTTMAIADSAPRVLNRPSDGSERPVANSLALFARPAPPPIPDDARNRTYAQQAGAYSHTGAQILSSAPTTNNANGAAIRVGYDTSLGKARGVFSFDLAGIPAHATIHGVSLTLDAFSANGTSSRYVDLELYPLDAAIAEDQVTWNQSTAGNNWSSPGGDFSAPPLSTLFAQQAIGLKTFVSTVDFVAAAQAALAAGQPLDLLVAATSAEAWGVANTGNLNLRFRSDDATIGQRPLLTVSYSYDPLPGDFNDDGVVNAADYVVWRKNSPPAPAQYQAWRARFGDGTTTGGAGASSVPEPPAVALLLIGMVAIPFRRVWSRAVVGSDRPIASLR